MPCGAAHPRPARICPTDPINESHRTAAAYYVSPFLLKTFANYSNVERNVAVPGYQCLLLISTCTYLYKKNPPKRLHLLQYIYKIAFSTVPISYNGEYGTGTFFALCVFYLLYCRLNCCHKSSFCLQIRYRPCGGRSFSFPTWPH